MLERTSQVSQRPAKTSNSPLGIRMKIKESKLLRIIREVIADVNIPESIDAMEQRHFGINTQDIGSLVELYRDAAQDLELPFLNPGEAFFQVMSKKFGMPITFIGNGAFRATLGIGDQFVVKLSNSSTESFNEMNRADYMLGTDKSIGHVFPRAFLHASDFNWVLLERVAHIEDAYQLQSYFRSPILVDPSSQVNSDDLAALSISIFTSRYMNLIKISLGMPAKGKINGKNIYRILPDDILLKDIDFKKYVNVIRVDAYNLDELTLGDLRWSLMQSPTYLKLFKAIKKYGIEVSEIRSDNMGIAADGSLVMLDSSI